MSERSEDWQAGYRAAIEDACNVVGHANAMAQDNARAALTPAFQRRWTLLAEALNTIEFAIAALGTKRDAPAETTEASEASEAQGRLGI